MAVHELDSGLVVSIEEFESYFDEDHKNYIYSRWEGDNVRQGLNILAKYFGEQVLIKGASKDEIHSVSIDSLIDRKITVGDVKKLSLLNWHIDENEDISCFV